MLQQPSERGDQRAACNPATHLASCSPLPHPRPPPARSESGPQGSVRPLTVVKDPAAWKACDWAGRQHEVVVQLDGADVAQLKEAVAAFMASGRPLSALQRPADFPLSGGLADKLAGVRRDLLRGRGFALLRGVPVAEWSEAESVAGYMGLGVHVGRPQPQSKDGKLINHVKMHYAPAGAPASTLPQREHAHNLEFGLHTDAQADVLGEPSPSPRVPCLHCPAAAAGVPCAVLPALPRSCPSHFKSVATRLTPLPAAPPATCRPAVHQPG